MPVEDESADWVVSNCVVNLAPDKKKVFRVLRPGDHLSVSDIVARLPRLLRLPSLHASCLSGTLPEAEYLAAVAAAGFQAVRVVARHVYDVEQLAALLGERRLSGRLVRCAAHPWPPFPTACLDG